MNILKKFIITVLLLFFLFLFYSSCANKANSGILYDYDILIKNGVVYDGTDKLPHKSDIGIKGDKIFATGNLTGSAINIIDAEGLIVTPGFIDVHSHTDMGFEEHGENIPEDIKGNYNYLYQGVTTIITGLCGDGMHTKDVFNLVDKIKFGANLYHMAPHGTIRKELFGDNQPKKLTLIQLGQMKEKIREEMEAGAIGMSTGLIYVPGALAHTEELIELAKVVKEYDGFYASHVRDEAGLSPDNVGIIESYKEAIEIGRKSGVSVEICHMKIMSPTAGVTGDDILNLIEKARKEGLDITGDQYPYEAACTNLAAFLPSKFRCNKGIKTEYRYGKGREELKEASRNLLSYIKPDKILIASCDRKPSLQGKYLSEIAGEEGKSPVGAYVDILCGGDSFPSAIYFVIDEETMKEIMKKAYVFTGSDGSVDSKIHSMGKPHPRSYGTFPRKIKKYVLEENFITLQQAIRSMTSLPAKKFRMKLRGMIKQGYYGDIVVMDLNKLSDNATYFDSTQYAAGIEYVIVNGVIELSNGNVTGERGGRALKRGE